MAFFYKIDPERVLHIPVFLLEILMQHMPALESQVMMDSISTLLVPHMEEDSRKDFLESLDELTEPLKPVDLGISEQFEFKEINPEKAAEFFRQLGIKTK